MEKFGRDIFNGVVSLEISGTMKEIPDSMFFNHLDLKEIFLSNSLCLRAIFSKAFYACNNLTHIAFPSSLKLIYGCAFMECKSLVEISIPPSVKCIESMLS